MTIAIGVLCRDGVVVGADREITLSTLKFEERKAHLFGRSNVSVGLVGSGSADLITLAAQELQRRLSDEMSLENVKTVVDDLAQEINAKHILTNPNAGHVLDLLIGVKTTPRGGERQVGLLKVKGTIAIWKEKYEAIGWGYELAHYLLAGLYGERDKITVARGTMLVAQALKASKTYAQYSGGPSDVIQLRLGWVADFVHEDDIRLHEESAEKFSRIIQPVMLAMTDINVTDQQLEQLIGKMMTELHAFRTSAFRERQSEKLRMSPLPTARHASIFSDESSSNIFGSVETSSSGPTIGDDDGED